MSQFLAHGFACNAVRFLKKREKKQQKGNKKENIT
jgi:hypothetical protein